MQNRDRLTEIRLGGGTEQKREKQEELMGTDNNALTEAAE